MKKKVLTVAAAVCVIALMACGTLAYFTANKSVTNKFMVAGYDPSNPSDPSNPDTPDELFSLTLTEPNGDGDKDNNYKNMYPGKAYKKDPTVTNTGKYDQWVRVTVTFDNGDKWLAVADKYFKSHDLFETLCTGYVSANWEHDAYPTAVNGSKQLVYTFYYKNKLAPTNTATLFTGVTIPTFLNTQDMADLATFNISVKADAIQADNTGASAKATFTSTSPKYWTEN